MSVEYKGARIRVKTYKDGISSLDLSYKKINDISDIRGLIELKNLTILKLSNNQITEIKDLENLTNLKHLDLGNNQIREIKGLDHLINLENLNLRNNAIPEIKGLENVRNLKYLYLMDNQIIELKGLENLKDLKTFTVYGNPVYEWIKKELGGDYRKAEMVVNYYAIRKGEYQFNEKEVIKFLEEQKEKLGDLINNKSYYEITKLLLDVYAKVRLEDKTIFYDFFGNLLLEHLNLFQGKFLKNYPFIIQKLSNKEIIEMESYIIEHFCVVEDEKLEIFFPGSIDLGRIILRGRLYFTNLRLFVLGIRESGSSGYGGGSDSLLDLLLIPTMIGSALKTQKMKHNIRKGAKTFEELPKFGYQIPLLNARILSIKRKTMSIRSKKYNIVIQPTKFTNEDKKEFLDRANNLFSNIRKLVLEGEL